MEIATPALQTQVQNPTSATATQDVAPASVARKPDVDNDYIARFAKLTQKEREVQKLAEEIKSIRSENERFKKLREEGKANPKIVLDEFGLSYEGLTKHMLEGGTTDDKYLTLEQRIAKMEEEKQLREQSDAEKARTESYHAGINMIKDFCEKSGDEFELLRLHNSYEDVIDLASKYYKETGKYLDYKEACKLVEDHLTEQAEVFASAKKLQSKLNLVAEVKDVIPHPPKNLESRTLSNSMTASSVTPEDTIDENELMARAIQTLRNGRIRS